MRATGTELLPLDSSVRDTRTEGLENRIIRLLANIINIKYLVVSFDFMM